MGNQFGHLHTTLPMRPELPGWSHNLGACLSRIVVFDVTRECFPVPFHQFFFRIKHVDLTGAALHPKRDHGSSSGGLLRRFFNRIETFANQIRLRRIGK